MASTEAENPPILAAPVPLRASKWMGLALTLAPFILLIAFPEGFINGTLVTAFIVLAPDSMKLYDSDDYSPDD